MDESPHKRRVGRVSTLEVDVSFENGPLHGMTAKTRFLPHDGFCFPDRRDNRALAYTRVDQDSRVYVYDPALSKAFMEDRKKMSTLLGPDYGYPMRWT